MQETPGRPAAELRASVCPLRVKMFLATHPPDSPNFRKSRRSPPEAVLTFPHRCTLPGFAFRSDQSAKFLSHVKLTSIYLKLKVGSSKGMIDIKAPVNCKNNNIHMLTALFVCLREEYFFFCKLSEIFYKRGICEPLSMLLCLLINYY